MGDKIEQQIQQPNPNLGAAEQILGALGMLGGSYLKGRSLTGRSWLGDPLSLAGQGLLGLGQYGVENRKKQEEQDALAAALPNTPEGQLIGKLMKGGATVPEASELAKLNFPSTKGAATPFEVWREQNPNAPLSDWYKLSRAQGKETPFDIWQKQNPKGTIADWEKLTHPAMNVNVERPVNPNEILRDKDTGEAIGVLDTDKAGNLTLKRTPVGVPPTAPKAKDKAITKTKIGGYDYEVTHAKGDPLNGIVRPPGGKTLGARLLGTKGIPQFLWRINGKFIDPSTLSPDDHKKYAIALMKKGFTMEEIEPSGR